MASEPRMPIGMSRCGFLVSSAAVATMSKPMKAKNTSAAAVKMPADAERARGEPEVLQQRRGRRSPPDAAGEPAGGMNGE